MDVWNIPRPQYRPYMNTTIHDFPINPSITGVADLLVCNNSWRKNKNRQHFHNSMEVDINSDFQRFNQPPKKITQCDHRLDGNLLDVDVSGKTPLQLKGTLNFPSISSANDVSSHLQNFYCFNEDDHDCLTKQYSDGLLLIEERDAAEQIDDVLKHHSSSIFSLISLDKIVPKEETLFGRYIFFGETICW